MTIPDLWSEDIQIDVLPPVAILRAQENPLGRKTKGILEAKVMTTTSESEAQHQLDLIAPALSHYRKTLLTARHSFEMVYPVEVRAPCFEPDGSMREFMLSKRNFAAGQEDFIQVVRKVLQSTETKAIIQSLISRSNEIRSVLSTVEGK